MCIRLGIGMGTDMDTMSMMLWLRLRLRIASEWIRTLSILCIQCMSGRAWSVRFGPLSLARERTHARSIILRAIVGFTRKSLLGDASRRSEIHQQFGPARGKMHLFFFFICDCAAQCDHMQYANEVCTLDLLRTYIFIIIIVVVVCDRSASSTHIQRMADM